MLGEQGQWLNPTNATANVGAKFSSVACVAGGQVSRAPGKGLLGFFTLMSQELWPLHPPSLLILLFTLWAQAQLGPLPTLFKEIHQPDITLDATTKCPTLFLSPNLEASGDALGT